MIRPFRPLPIIYQVDTETNRRWIAYQVAFGRFGMLWIVAYVLVGQSRTLGHQIWWVAIPLLGYGWLLILLRGARRVPKRRWVGPAMVDRAGRYSRTTWAIWLVVSLLMTAMFAYIGLSGRYGPVRPDTIALIIGAAAVTIMFAVRLFGK